MQEGAHPKSQALGRLPVRSIRETILGAAFSYADVWQKKKIPASCHAQTVLYNFYFSLLLSLERLRADNLMESMLRITPWPLHATRSAAGFPPIYYRQNYKRRSPSPCQIPVAKARNKILWVPILIWQELIKPLFDVRSVTSHIPSATAQGSSMEV